MDQKEEMSSGKFNEEGRKKGVCEVDVKWVRYLQR
jgi:hypothetical protein